MPLSDSRVQYEAVIRSGQAGCARLGQALMECGARLLDSYLRGDVPEATVLLRLEPSAEARFREILKPLEWRYRSPVRLERGAMVPVYPSPAEEVRARLEAARNSSS